MRSLYSNPRAQVHLLGRYSEPFTIEKGTMQGCPLSPIVFAIAIETLAFAIRHHPSIKGVQCGPQEHKCVLFADDLLLFVTSPLISTPNILQLLHDFDKISGL